MISATPGAASASRGGTNVKHAGVLQEAGIVYDNPLNPVQVAAVRAERIAQKQKTALAEQLQAQQQQQAQQQAQQQQRAGNVSAASPASGASLTPGSPIATARLTPIPVASPSTSTMAVNQAAASNNSSATATTVVMSSINSATTGNQHTLLLQGSSPSNLQTGTSPQQQLILQPASAAGAIRAQRQVTTLTMQDVANAGQIRPQQPGQLAGSVSSQNLAGQTVVTVSNLTAVQVQAATQMLASAGIVSGAQLNTITTTAAGSVKGTTVTVVQTTPTSTGTSPAPAAPKALTHTQLQYFRQQVLVKQHQQQQQQRLQEQQLKKLQLNTAGNVTGSPQGSTTPTATSPSVQKVPLVAVSAASVATTSPTLGNFTSVQIAGAGRGADFLSFPLSVFM